MTRAAFLVSTLCSATLALGCVKDDASDATSATTTQPATPGSGSATSTTDSVATTTTPTTSTTTTSTTTTSTTTITTTSTSGSSTSTSMGDPCETSGCCSFLCQDLKPECDLWAQDCPEGQKCAGYFGSQSWAVKCVDVTGTDQPGDACTTEGTDSGIDSCIAGARCWFLDMEGVGTCVALCTGTPEAPVCEAAEFCMVANDGVLNLCLPVCDPLLQDCPTEILACYPIEGSFGCVPDASGDEGQANDPCEYINVCDEGLMCGDAASVGAGCEPPATGCCTPFCEYPGGPCPNPDQQCMQYFAEPFPPDPANPGHIGVCGVPN